MFAVRSSWSRYLATGLMPLVGIFYLALPAASAELNETRAFSAALQSITTPELGRHVEVLADDSFEGRQAGSRGGRAAGGYLIKAMQDDAIAPAGDDGGYFQLFHGNYRNVLGMIEGRDPQLKRDFIVIGAHYDHVGYGSARNSFGPTGYIHNGADDNASGTAGVLEMMQAFASLAQPPRRSILFAFWDGEEEGLLGSKHFVRYPTVPLRNVVMVFNCDMIGRLRDQQLEVYGVRTAFGLRRLLSQANRGYGMSLDFIWDVAHNSDHYPFYQHDIPFLMFHTGLHGNYHRPSDDAELINREGMLSVAQLMFRVAYEVAETDQTLVFRQQARSESNHTRSQFERARPAAPPRLGVSWSREDEESGLLLTRVTVGSSADQAGLRTGDRILKFDGQVIHHGDHFRLLVLAAPAHTTAVIRRPGQSDPIQAELSLPGDPVRIGISWDQDEADRSIVLLTRVLPGSAADQAGLQAGDRVYAVNGEVPADGSEFGRLITERGGPLRLQIERRGLVRDVTLDPLDATRHEVSLTMPLTPAID